MTSKPPLLRALHTGKQSATEDGPSHEWVMPGSLRLDRQYTGRQPRTDLLRMHAANATHAGDMTRHINNELPPLFRYTFQPGDGQPPRLVDIWHHDAVPAQTKQCRSPYYVALIRPPDLVRSLHEAGFVFSHEPTELIARKGFTSFALVVGNTTPWGKVTETDCVYAETLLSYREKLIDCSREGDLA